MQAFISTAMAWIGVIFLIIGTYLMFDEATKGRALLATAVGGGLLLIANMIN